MLVDTNSLAKTIDSIEEALFFRSAITPEQKHRASIWLADRQGLKGSYHGMFAPTEYDFQNGIQLFTGEKISSWAGTSHILGELTCCSLLKLDDDDSRVRASLVNASKAIMSRLSIQDIENPGKFGMFCCGVCSVSLWRHINSGGLDRQDERLNAGLNHLKLHRKGDGTWGIFPFYFTLLALSEMDHEMATLELLYAENTVRRRLKRIQSKDDIFSRRRKELLTRIVARY